jgi:hypothetical protein
MRQLLFTLLLGFSFQMACPGLLSGQTRHLYGKLQDQQQIGLAHATLLLKNQKDQILRFTHSNEDGSFKIAVPDTLTIEKAYLEINLLGFKKRIFRELRTDQSLQIELEVSRIALEDIRISKERITRLGDTLEIDIASFVKPEDRSIGDVLRRIPGMEILETGEIVYNGKSLANFYIDGGDLLGDRYGIGTKAIQHRIVEKVQIIQNHQPIKVLQNRVFTDQVALNLVIKEEARLSLTGHAKWGAGLPEKYDAEWNTMLFNKRYKTLNVIKGNNVGQDLSSELASFSAANPFSSPLNSKPTQMLSAGIGGNPPLPRNRYLRNRSGSLQINQLFTLSPAYQLRVAASGLLDRQRIDQWSEQLVFILQDTIGISETSQQTRYPFQSDLSLDLKRNDSTLFLQNLFKLVWKGDRTDAYSLRQHTPLHQQLKNRIYDFSNQLSFIPQLNSRTVLDFTSQTSFYTNPHHLAIQADSLGDLTLLDHTYLGAFQQVKIPSFEQKFNASMSLKTKGFTQTYGMQLRYEQQQLRSTLTLSDTDQEAIYHDPSAQNFLRWQHIEWGGSARYFWTTQRWQTNVYLPVSIHKIKYKDANHGLAATHHPIWFQPQAQIKYLMNVQDYWSASYGYQQQTGGLQGVYKGYILNNYRSLTAYDTDLLKQNGHHAGLTFNLVRSLQMLFANIGVQYAQSQYNQTTTTWIEEEITRNLSLPIKRNQSSWSVQGGISKFLFGLGATSGLKAQWSSSQFDQYVNNGFLPIRSIQYSVRPNLEMRLWKKITVQYEAGSIWSKTVIRQHAPTSNPQQIWQLDQTFLFQYPINPKLHVRLSGRNLYTQRPSFPSMNYWFGDALVRYKLTRWKADLELEVQNLTNVKQFESYQLNSYQSNHSRYVLNGRMGIVRITMALP